MHGQGQEPLRNGELTLSRNGLAMTQHLDARQTHHVLLHQLHATILEVNTKLPYSIVCLRAA